MADKIIGVKIEADTGSAITNVKSFKQELKEANEQVIKMGREFGETSKEAAEAAKRVAGLKDQMGDAQDLINAFNPDSFRAIGQAVNTVVGGFTALQGVMGLVGAESKETEKLLLKVQSALAIQQGIASIQEGVGVFKSLSVAIQQSTIFQKANAVATNLASGAMRLFGIQTTVTSTAMNVLKGAIIATGVGALVVLLGVAAQAMGVFSDSTDDAADAQERFDEKLKNVNDQLDKQLSSLDRDQKLAVARLKAKGASENEIFNTEQEFRRKNLKALEEANAKQVALDGVIFSDKLEKIRNLHTEIELAELQHEERLFNNAKTAQAKAAAEREKNKEKPRLEKDPLSRIQALDIVIPKTEKQLQIEAEENALLKAASTNQATKGLIANTDKVFTAIHGENVNERMANERAEFEAKEQIANAGISILGSLSALVGQQTKTGKILALAEIAAGTAKGFINALNIAQQSAKATGPAAAFAFPLFYVTQIAAVLSAAAKAKSILGSSGGGSSVSAPTPISVSAPLQPQRAQQTTTQLNQDSLNAIGNSTVRAFFLESDFEGRERIVRLNRMARIGG